MARLLQHRTYGLGAGYSSKTLPKRQPPLKISRRSLPSSRNDQNLSNIIMKISSWKYVVAVSAALLVHAGIARGATCSVPSVDHPTIQAAVDDATCSVVEVAPGVYAENV